MRISFVGKGGSGKSTLCALFAQYARNQGENVLAIDADLNIHLPRLLGFEKPDKSLHISDPSATATIKKRLSGSNDRIGDLATFRKSTPPGTGSNLILLEDAKDPILDAFSVASNDMRLMVVGTYGEEDVGASCYHNDLAIFENVMSYLADERGIVVADMVAGTDAFASTLHAQFDLTVLVVEPTWRGIEVYKDYAKLCEHAGCLHGLKVIGNKIKSDEDRALIKEHIPAEVILGYVNQSAYLEKQDRTWNPIRIEDMEDGTVSVITAAYDALKHMSYDPQKRLQKMWDLHRTYVSQNFIVERFGDLTTQIDESFDIRKAAEEQRLCQKD